MKIKYVGHSCFLFEGQRTRILTDPLSFSSDGNQEHFIVDIVTVSHNHPSHANTGSVSGTSYVIHSAGEYEVGGTYITGLSCFHDDQNGLIHGKNIIYIFQIDEIRICHMGDLGHILSGDILKEIEGVDVLLIPVGGGNALDALKATEIARRVSPRYIIPMHYQSKQFPNFDSVETFLHQAGCDRREDLKELSVGAVSGTSEMVDAKTITLLAKYS